MVLIKKVNLQNWKFTSVPREMKTGPVDLSRGLSREAAREYSETTASSASKSRPGTKKKQSFDCFSSWYPGRDLNPHAVAGSRF